MNAKISVFVIYVEAIICLLFVPIFSKQRDKIPDIPKMLSECSDVFY